jgi:hypothetical protein
MTHRKRMQHGSISKGDLFVIYWTDGSVAFSQSVKWSLWISKQRLFFFRPERRSVPDDGVDDRRDDATSFRFAFSAIPDDLCKRRTD